MRRKSGRMLCENGEDKWVQKVIWEMCDEISGTVWGHVGVLSCVPVGTGLTDSHGHYSILVNDHFSGEICASGYTYLPNDYNNVTNNIPNQDFSPFPKPEELAISGTITCNGAPLEGIRIANNQAGLCTNFEGRYEIVAPMGWAGTITPFALGYTFSPPSRYYNDLEDHLRSENYVATSIPTYRISGTVTLNGSSFAGVSMNGLPGNIVTNSLGQYSVTVNAGWSGNVTPGIAGYVFTPANRSYSNLDANQSDQNYTAAQDGNWFTVSGKVKYNGLGLAGVELVGFPFKTFTDSSGIYSTTVWSGWGGKVMPTLPGYKFTPGYHNYSINENTPNQDYIADLYDGTFKISGTARGPIGIIPCVKLFVSA